MRRLSPACARAVAPGPPLWPRSAAVLFAQSIFLFVFDFSNQTEKKKKNKFCRAVASLSFLVLLTLAVLTAVGEFGVHRFIFDTALEFVTHPALPGVVKYAIYVLSSSASTTNQSSTPSVKYAI